MYLLVKNSKLGGVPEEIIREFCINNYVEEDFPVEEIESIMEVYNDDEIKFGKYKYIYIQKTFEVEVFLFTFVG